jgi:hypothetical protein
LLPLPPPPPPPPLYRFRFRSLAPQRVAVGHTNVFQPKAWVGCKWLWYAAHSFEKKSCAPKMSSGVPKKPQASILSFFSKKVDSAATPSPAPSKQEPTVAAAVAAGSSPVTPAQPKPVVAPSPASSGGLVCQCPPPPPLPPPFHTIPSGAVGRGRVDFSLDVQATTLLALPRMGCARHPWCPSAWGRESWGSQLVAFGF